MLNLKIDEKSMSYFYPELFRFFTDAFGLTTMAADYFTKWLSGNDVEVSLWDIYNGFHIFENKQLKELYPDIFDWDYPVSPVAKFLEKYPNSWIYYEKKRDEYYIWFSDLDGGF